MTINTHIETKLLMKRLWEINLLNPLNSFEARTETYTIISGTNRVGSQSERVAAEYKKVLSGKSVDARLLCLTNIDVLCRTTAFVKIEEEILIPTQKFIFIIPEYN